MNNKLIFKSSNAHKVNEFKRLFGDTEIVVESGEDLREVSGTIDEVVVYKALEAGENVLVEDTTMIINGKEEIEIKWKYNDLQTGDKLTWIISLGVFREGRVDVYRGQIDCVVNRNLGADGVVFEPFIVPIENNPEEISFTQLSLVIDKDIIDPRAMAVKELLSEQPLFSKNIEDIAPWTGAWQND